MCFSWARTSSAARPTPWSCAPAGHRVRTHLGAVCVAAPRRPSSSGAAPLRLLPDGGDAAAGPGDLRAQRLPAKPVLDSFLFALALAVGLTPQLLPAIISVNLARGAKHMAAQQVIVKRLTAIENFGSMDVLCSDKTGTLTEGRCSCIRRWMRPAAENDRVLLHAYLNASFQTGFANPIDAAISRARAVDADRLGTGSTRCPYDFVRKRLSVLASHDGHLFIMTKGALETVLAVCTAAETDGRPDVPIEQAVAGDPEAASPPSSAPGLSHARRRACGTWPVRGAIRREDEQRPDVPRARRFARPAEAGRHQHDSAAAPLGRFAQDDHRRQRAGRDRGRPAGRSGQPTDADRADLAADRATKRCPSGAARRRRVRRDRAESEGAHHPRAAARPGTSSATWATASTTRRRCTRPT